MCKVWLDDLRDPKDPFIQTNYGADGTEVWVNSVEEAITLLETGAVTSISLDNDLGEGLPEGYDVALWLEEAAFFNRIPRLEIWAHSDNCVANPKMRKAIENAYRYWERHAH